MRLVKGYAAVGSGREQIPQPLARENPGKPHGAKRRAVTFGKGIVRALLFSLQERRDDVPLERVEVLQGTGDLAGSNRGLHHD